MKMISHIFVLFGMFFFYAVPNSEAGDVHSFLLARSDSVPTVYVRIPTDEQEVSFRKEPDYKGHEIVRGVLPVGRNKKDYIAFAWDATEYFLYIDRNRNFDLTDDQESVFYSRYKTSRYARFDKITIETETTNEAMEYTVSVMFQRIGRGNYSSTVLVSSGWSGTIDIDGREWHVAVTDNCDGVFGNGDLFVIRPVRERWFPDNKRMQMEFYDKISLPRYLFLGRQEYELFFEFEPEDTGDHLWLTMTETDTPTGRLIIEGGNLWRFILTEKKENETAAVILVDPDSINTVPARTYTHRTTMINGGKLGLLKSDNSRDVTIDPEKPVTLKTGVPLENTVSIGRSGWGIQFFNELVGSGGELYRQVFGGYGPVPTFAIYREGKKITSGAFRYG